MVSSPSTSSPTQRPLGSVTVAEAPTVLRIHANSTAGDLNGYFVVVNGGESSAPIDIFSSANDLKVHHLHTPSYISPIAYLVYGYRPYPLNKYTTFQHALLSHRSFWRTC